MQIERGLTAGLIASSNYLNKKDPKLSAAIEESEKAINNAKFTFLYITKNKQSYLRLIREYKI